MGANIQYSTGGSNLADMIDHILDRGAVIDAFVRVTLGKIELLKVEAHVVIASFDTWAYLKYAEGIGLTTAMHETAPLW